MGRIADAALDVLAAGPASVQEVAAALAQAGATRARDPASAVRRALRDDPRVVEVREDHLVSVAQALQDVTLTIVVTADAAAAGAVETSDDLAPLGFLGLGPTLGLPEGTPAGATVCVRVEDALAGQVSVEAAAGLAPVVTDEEALAAAVSARIGAFRADAPWLAPPVTHLATIGLMVMSERPEAFRRAGRPLSLALQDAGFEVHLGWVGPAGTEWESLTQEEADALEDEVTGLLVAEEVDAAALVQERLLVVLDRHLPERVPAARRRWARLLCRAGRVEEGLAALRSLFVLDDPEDRYEAALTAIRLGEDATARRLVQEGLARTEEPDQAEVASCLDDLASDLDAQAAFLRLRDTLAQGAGPIEEFPLRVAQAIVGPSRSYLVETMVEEVFGRAEEEGAATLLAVLSDEGGDVGREACLACSGVLPDRLADIARRAAGGRTVARDAVRGLLDARPVGAWATAPEDAPDQRQLVLAVAKEHNRVSPLVVLIDYVDLEGGVKDAFFLPDMVEPRMRRELFARMAEVGVPNWPIELDEAIRALRFGLRRTSEIGWRLPSLDRQPVLERIEHRVLRPYVGPTADRGRRPPRGREPRA